MERKIGTIMLVPGFILAIVAAAWMTQIVVKATRESGVLESISRQAPSTGEDLYSLARTLWDIVYGVPAGFVRAAAGKVTIIIPGEGGLPSPSSVVTYATPPGYYGPVMGPSAEGEVGPGGVSPEQEAETRAQTALNLLLACNVEAKTVAEAAIGYDPANQTALGVQAAASGLLSLFNQLSAATTPATRAAVAAQILDFEFQGQQPCAENPLARAAKTQAETAVTAQQQAQQAQFQEQLALQEYSAWLATSDYAPTGPNLADHRWKEPTGPPSDAESLRKLAGKNLNLVIKRTNAPGFFGVPRDSDVYAGDMVDPTTGSAVGSFIVNRRWLSSYTTWTGGGAGTVVQIKGNVTPWPWGQQSLAPLAPSAKGPSAVAPEATPTKVAPAAGLPPEEGVAPPALPPAITPTPVPTVVIRALAPECAEVPNRATVDGTRQNCRRGLRLDPEQAESSQFVLPDGHELLFGEAFPGVEIDGVLHTFVWAYYPPLDKQGWADYACLVPQGPITAGCQAAPTPSPTPPWRWTPSQDWWSK